MSFLNPPLKMYKKMFHTEDHLEGPFGPSMVEPCHNLSLSDLLRDYSLGILHTEREAFYDEGSDLDDEPPQVPDDLSEAMPSPYAAAPQAQTEFEDERSEDDNEVENGEPSRGWRGESERGAAPSQGES